MVIDNHPSNTYVIEFTNFMQIINDIKYKLKIKMKNYFHEMIVKHISKTNEPLFSFGVSCDEKYVYENPC